uniref:EGF-like domain-containing protein n=1 Tax=Amphimedon queenslandica TaxID=400682 RepID=A0A1X7T247_AMPQE
MTSFQRMVLVAAALFMITAHVADAETQCGCFKNGNCRGDPQQDAGADGRVCCRHGFPAYGCRDSSTGAVVVPCTKCQ